MKISIVMPAYNAAPYIRKAIESVLNQPYPNKELIVIDGNSSDNTVEILKTYGARITWISEKDRGQADAINKGLKKATGEIVTWLNADDYYEPNIFSKIAEIFVANPEAVLVYGNCKSIPVLDPAKFVINIPPKTISAQKMIREGNFIYQPSSFYKTSTIKNVGYVDDSLHFWMEYDLFIKLLQKGNSVYTETLLSNFIVRGDQKSDRKNLPAMDKEMLAISKKYGGGGLFSRLRVAIWYHALTTCFQHKA